MVRLPKAIFTLFAIFWAGNALWGQDRAVPKPIRAKGVYIHTPSETAFPECFETLKRTSIYVYDKQEKNVSVTYQDGLAGRKTILGVSVYPAGMGYEGRLREEYLNSIYAMRYSRAAHSGRDESGLAFEQKPIRYEGERYTCTGFRALQSDESGYSAMSLYECGTWFLKIWVNSEAVDTAEVIRLERLAVAAFDPTGLTALDPLTVAERHIAPDAFQDSTLLLCVRANAAGKLRWAYDSIPERERASGFPDLYLRLHMYAWKAFVRGESFVPEISESQYRTDFTNRYLRDWKTVVESGYLAEFLMDRYRMVMIAPEDIELDMEGYYRWQEDHPVDIDLNQKYSMIVYRPESGTY